MQYLHQDAHAGFFEPSTVLVLRRHPSDIVLRSGALDNERRARRGWWGCQHYIRRRSVALERGPGKND